MRSRVLWLFSIGGLLVLTGCPGSTTSTPPAELPLAGQTVQIHVPADLTLRELWEPLLQEWRAQTGAEVEWHEYDSAAASWTDPNVGGDLATGGRVILLPLTKLADADAAGWLSPFPSVVVDQIDKKDLFPGIKEAALSRQKQLMAAPVSTPTLLCYYRKDLLEAAGLQPPATWDDYQTVLEKLSTTEPKLPALEPCGPDFLASLFLARAIALAKHPQNYSVCFDIQTGEPLFDSPAFERALETARAAWKLMPESIWNASPMSCRRELLEGRASLVLAWEPSASYPRLNAAEFDVISRESMSIGVTRLPGTRSVYQREGKRWETISAEQPYQPGLVGFTGLVLGVRALNERAGAWDLVKMLSTHPDQAFDQRPRSAGRESEAGYVGETGELSREALSLLADAHAETLRRREVVFDLPIPQADELRRIIATELAAARDDLKTSAEILAVIQEKITAATEDRRSEIRDALRRSAGLMPIK